MTKVIEGFICTFQWVRVYLRAYRYQRSERQKFLSVMPGQIGNRLDDSLSPEK